MLTITSGILPAEFTGAVPLPSQNVTRGLGYWPSLYKRRNLWGRLKIQAIVELSKNTCKKGVKYLNKF
jgi:hypothetical protein